MRTGAIFARGTRGSCRAAAWLLALGAAAVLSVGEAAAQAPELSPATLTLDEGTSGNSRLTVADSSVVSDTVKINVESAVGGSFDLNWSGGTTLVASSVNAGVTGDEGSIVVPKDQAILLSVTANIDSDADDARVVLSFAIGLESATLILQANDGDTSGVMVSERALTVDEGGAVDSYTIKLGTQPSDDVMVEAKVTKPINARIMVALDTGILDDPVGVPGTSQMLTFTDTDWAVAQTVYVMALGDANTRNGSAEITNKARSTDGDYSGVSGRTVVITEYDNVRTITLSTSADSVEEGEEITITASLGNSGDTPAVLPAPVVVTLTKKGTTPPSGDFSVDDNGSTGSNKITIAAHNTSGSATLEAEHDADADDENVTLVASVEDASNASVFTEINNEEFSVTLVDDDTYTLEADDYEIAEGKDVTLTVTVEPKADVETMVKIDLYRAAGATVGPEKDQDADADGEYAIIVEGDSKAEFTLKAGTDAGDSMDEMIVARALVKDGASDKVVGDRIEIAVLDTQAAPTYTLSLEPDSIGEADGEQSVMLMVETNKVISTTKDTMLTLAVDAASTATATTDYTIMPVTVTIAEGEKMGMTTFMVTPVADSMDESNETIVLTAWKDDAQVGNAATLTIIDGDSPGSGITPKSGDDVAMVFSDAIEMAGGLMVGGNMVSVDMSMLFNMSNADAEVMYIVSSSDESVLGVSSSDSTLMLDPMMEGMSTVSVMAQPAGMASARGAVTTAFTCTGACVSVNLDVAGAVTFMLTGPEDMNIAEGMSAMVMVTASSAVAADTELMLMRDGTSTAGMDDYSVKPMMATIMAGETMAEFEVMATADDMMEDMEMLTLFLVVDDMQMSDSSVSLYLWDAAVPALPIVAQFLLGGLLAVGGYRRYRRR